MRLDHHQQLVGGIFLGLHGERAAQHRNRRDQRNSVDGGHLALVHHSGQYDRFTVVGADGSLHLAVDNVGKSVGLGSAQGAQCHFVLQADQLAMYVRRGLENQSQILIGELRRRNRRGANRGCVQAKGREQTAGRAGRRKHRAYDGIAFADFHRRRFSFFGAQKKVIDRARE